jgi:hypothetical protein
MECCAGLTERCQPLLQHELRRAQRFLLTMQRGHAARHRDFSDEVALYIDSRQRAAQM